MIDDRATGERLTSYCGSSGKIMENGSTSGGYENSSWSSVKT